jgi:hypothetical protein
MKKETVPNATTTNAGLVKKIQKAANVNDFLRIGGVVKAMIREKRFNAKV